MHRLSHGLPPVRAGKVFNKQAAMKDGCDRHLNVNCLNRKLARSRGGTGVRRVTAEGRTRGSTRRTNIRRETGITRGKRTGIESAAERTDTERSTITIAMIEVTGKENGIDRPWH